MRVPLAKTTNIVTNLDEFGISQFWGSDMKAEKIRERRESVAAWWALETCQCQYTYTDYWWYSVRLLDETRLCHLRPETDLKLVAHCQGCPEDFSGFWLPIRIGNKSFFSKRKKFCVCSDPSLMLKFYKISCISTNSSWHVLVCVSDETKNTTVNKTST